MGFWQPKKTPTRPPQRPVAKGFKELRDRKKKKHLFDYKEAMRQNAIKQRTKQQVGGVPIPSYDQYNYNYTSGHSFINRESLQDLLGRMWDGDPEERQLLLEVLDQLSQGMDPRALAEWLQEAAGLIQNTSECPRCGLKNPMAEGDYICKDCRG